MARADEFDAVTQVWLDSHVSTGLATASDATFAECARGFRARIAQGWQLYVAVLDGEIAAMLAFRTRDNYLDQIFVAPEHQGNGIGKALLAFTRRHLPEEILLRTAVANHRAIAWYEREGFVRENEVMQEGWSGPRVYYRWRAKDGWADCHRRWSHLKPPLRANDEVTAEIGRQIAHHRARVLLLGVTPELSGLANVAVDKSQPMIAHIWPGDSDARRAVHADWLALPFEAPQFTAVIGDGSLNAISYAQYPALFAQLVRVLLPGARLAVRVYETPAPGERLTDVRNAALAGEIAGFHAFKWRLAMALAAETALADVPVAAIHAAFEARFRDRSALAQATGWSIEEIAEIDAYAGNAAVYSFPTRAEILAALPPTFAAPRMVSAGTYPLAERCPILVADFTP